MSPFARGIRTFLQVLAGYAVTFVGIDWVTNYKAGIVTVALGLIAAALAGISGMILAYVPTLSSDSVAGRAAISFLQSLGFGIATLAVADFGTNSIGAFGRNVVAVVFAAIIAGLLTFGQNASEAAPATASPAARRRR